MIRACFAHAYRHPWINRGHRALDFHELMYKFNSRNLLLFHFIAERKILLVTGYPRDTCKPVQILNKDGQPESCPSIQSYPLGLYGAMGALLNDKVVIYSGDFERATNKFYQLGDNGQWAPFGAGLKTARCAGAAASVTIQGEEYLWITGGRDAR